MDTCDLCGSPGDGTPFCPVCGQRIGALSSAPPPADPPQRPTPTAAMVLPESQQEPQPTVQPAPQPVVADPRRDRSRTPWIILGVAVLLLAVIGTGAWLTRGDDDATADGTVTGDTSGDTFDDATPLDEPSPLDEEPAPEPQEPVTVTCWNGEEVDPAVESCALSPYDEELLRFAFPVDWSTCSASSLAPYNGLSFHCMLQGQRIHLATYADRAGRVQRLTQYGFPDCASAPGGRITCGPTDTGRYVRTYQDSRLRLYMSAPPEAAEVLRGLPQRPASELLRGTSS